MELIDMMLQLNKTFVCMQLYYGQLMTFLHMRTFQGRVLKGNLFVLIAIKKPVPIDCNIGGSFAKWVIINFF